MKKIFAIVLTAGLLFSCSKNHDEKNNDKPQHQPIAGMGETPGTLQGAVFNLPDGITLVNNEIKGDISGEICKNVGSGTFVDVYFVLKNTKTTNISVTFPAGLTFKALDAEDQNGIHMQDETITVNAGAVCLVYFKAYCINSSRHGSSSTSNYAWGPITDAPEMRYLIELCKNKNVDDYNLQDPIWSITDFDGLLDFDIEEIKQLPNK